MREMRDSGVEWIGQVPRHWELVRLKNLIESREGGAWGEDAAGTAEDVICLRIADFDYKKYRFKSQGDLTIRNYKPNVIERLRLSHGDILVEKSGGGEKTPVGRAVIFDKEYPALYANFMDRLRCIKDVNPYWLLYNWVNLYANNYTRPYIKQTTGIQNLDIASLLASQYAAMPPDNEQKIILNAISDKTEKVDSLISNVQSQIEKLKAYKQSLITEAVTKGLDPTVPMKDSGVEWIGEIPEHWSVAALKYFTDILPGYAFSSNDFHAEAGVPLLRGVNVTPNGIRWEDTVYWNKEITDNLKPFILQLNDIVVGLDRPWISEGTRITRMKGKDLPSLLLQRVCRIRVKGFMDSSWVFLWIASNAFKESLSTETTGISVPHISTKQIGDFIVAIPPIEVQKEICEFIDAKCAQIDRLITIKQAKIEKLEQYKRSLIYEYVTGKKEII